VLRIKCCAEKSPLRQAPNRKPPLMKPLLFILTIAFIISCKTKQITLVQTNFSFSRPQLGEIEWIENQNSGIRIYKPFKISVAKNYFPNADKLTLGQPLLYLRDTASIRTQITYFFSEPDSLMRLVEYSWDNLHGKQNVIEPLYESNKKQISRMFRLTGNETIETHEAWSQKTIIWQNDSIHIKQFMLIQGTPSRTRVLISWKK